MSLLGFFRRRSVDAAPPGVFPRESSVEERLLRIQAELLAALLDGSGGGWPEEDALPRRELDGSLASLQAVDRYLASVHRRKGSLPGQVRMNLIIAIGAYVCRVVSQETAGGLASVTWTQAIGRRPPLQDELPFGWRTALLLADAECGRVLSPLGRVADLIENGPERSVWAWARDEIAPRPPRGT